MGLGGRIGEEYGENQRERGGIAGKGASSVGLALSRGVGAPDRIMPRRAGSFIGLASAPAGFWGRECGRVFGPVPK
jgi:hypothetical protein